MENRWKCARHGSVADVGSISRPGSRTASRLISISKPSLNLGGSCYQHLHHFSAIFGATEARSLEIEVKDDVHQLWLHFKFQVAKWNHSQNEVEYSGISSGMKWNEAILRAKCPAFEGLALLRVCVWGQITMCDWQLYQAKPQAWPSDPSARVAAFASRCEGLGWARYG